MVLLDSRRKLCSSCWQLASWACSDRTVASASEASAPPPGHRRAGRGVTGSAGKKDRCTMRTDLLQQRLHAGPCWFTDRPSGGANTGDSTRAAVCLGRRPTAASSTRHGACWRPHTPAGLQLTDQQPCARHGCCSHKGVCATHTRPGAPNGLSEDSIRIHVSTLPRFPRARATSGSHGGLRVCAPGCCAHPGPAPELGHSTW